ncbi:transposase [Nitratireductor thuwali]|uniref:transposase n=1 Tax=Nitratireductor thuwali TaxID=2267699 RepID=UPI003BAF5FA8
MPFQKRPRLPEDSYPHLFPLPHLTVSAVPQALGGLSDDQAEFQIQDRLSFMRFLGLVLGDRVPDARLGRYGCPANISQAAPKQRDSGAEKADIEADKVPDACVIAARNLPESVD